LLAQFIQTKKNANKSTQEDGEYASDGEENEEGPEATTTEEQGLYEATDIDSWHPSSALEAKIATLPKYERRRRMLSRRR